MIITTKKLAFCEEELHEAAVRKASFDDFGNDGYRSRLRVFLEAIDTDLRLSESNWRVLYDMIVRDLVARLYTQRGWAEHPEALATQIQRPVVIVGLPRTGTTALHRLLSVDPQFQGPETWLVEHPMVRPPRNTWEAQAEYRTCVASLEQRYAQAPELRKAHRFAASEVEDCGGILAQSFVRGNWAAWLPSYARWVLEQNMGEPYRRYANVLRLVGAHDEHRRWLLKGTTHSGHIATLLEVFPDACIILTHRDPLRAIPSACSTLQMLTASYLGESSSTHAVGPWMCARWRRAIDRIQKARPKYPKQFFDVDHRLFVTDPLKTVHSIYDYFKLTLSPHAEQRMRAWVAISPEHRHGRHEYAMDSWGITSSQICDALADYRAQHQFV